MYMGIVAYTNCKLGVHGGQKRTSELEFPGTELVRKSWARSHEWWNWTSVMWKSSQCSYSLSHFFSTSFIPILTYVKMKGKLEYMLRSMDWKRKHTLYKGLLLLENHFLKPSLCPKKSWNFVCHLQVHCRQITKWSY